MTEGSAALCWKGQIPHGVIRPKEEYIKPCETCFAKNALSFLIRIQVLNEFVPQSFIAL